MDDVNNESEIYTMGPIHFDNKAPIVSDVIFSSPAGNRTTTNETSQLIYSFNYTDVGTGAVKATITGDDIDTIVLDLVETDSMYSGKLSFKAGTEDGMKTITVVVSDKAGNASEPVTSNALLLDRDLEAPTLVLQNDSNINLPEYINYSNIKACLTVAETVTDITGYKIWEGIDNEPEDWITQPAGTLNITVDLVLSAGDGEKTIYAKIIDSALNTTAAPAMSVIVDTVAPTAELQLDRSIISNKESYNKAILTFGATADNAGGSGVKTYKLTRSSGATGEMTTEVIETWDSLPEQYEISVGTLTDGIYNYNLEAIDKAENKTISVAVSLQIDTTVPVLEIGNLQEWYTDKFSINVTYQDASQLQAMYVWTSTTANDQEVGSTASIEPAMQIDAAHIAWNLAQSASNYMHVKLIDCVGNVSYAHKQFGYDNVKPEFISAQFTAEAYPSPSAKLEFEVKDVTSEVGFYKVTGHITDSSKSSDWEVISEGTTRVARDVVLTGGDGAKTVRIQIKDKAGNETYTEVHCELDTSFPQPELTLFEADNINSKAAHSAVAEFSVRLQITGDDELGKKYYKLYGDFSYDAQSETRLDIADVAWKEYTVDTGKTYMTIPKLFCTKGDGDKNIYVVVKDNAGNETPLVDPKSFVYDTTPPTLTLDYSGDTFFNRISKVHVERRNTSGIMVGKWADITEFKLTTAEKIQAYKVCAYKDASAAAAVTDVNSEVAIGTAHNSANTSATNLNQLADVLIKITGADYEDALIAACGESYDPEVGVDGGHIIVVYVQDLAGTWSAIAQFN
jgi:hypothetical protein